MSSEHEKYLAANVIADGSIVTSRSFSHNFKIHASKAKQILQNFHQSENAKKPGSVHATYFISGFKDESHAAPAQPPDADGDVAMPSSPGFSSSLPRPAEEDEAPQIRVLTLAREHQLEEIKAQFRTVTTVQIYSVGPAPITDFEVLSTVTQQINERHADEDPLVYFKQYGVIQNPHVQRRTAPKKGTTAVPVDSATVFSTKQKAPAPSEKSTPSSTATGSQKDAKGPVKKETKPASFKKENSDLFKSFAKAKPKPPSKPDPTADVPMTGDSESEEEDVKSQSNETSTKLKEEREGRQERMRALMDEDDEPMKDAGEEVEDPESEVEPEPEPEPEPQADEPAPQSTEPEEEPPVTTSNGRRRGKRRVMKKKTMKDDEGYLITKEEAVWESFSEDEAPTPQSSKPKPGSKSKAPTGKAQGSIMSFFGKK